MKQYRKPTRDQKEILTAHGYNPSEWRYVGIVEEDHMEFVNPNGKDKEHIFLDRNKRR